jgi:DNA-binding MarR family transcriptional regulator
MADAQQLEESRWLVPCSTSRLDRAALQAWRSYRQSHASIVLALDRELVAEHGITTRDYEVLLDLAHAPDRKLAMSDLAKSTRLTRSGITRLIDRLVGTGLIQRVRRSSDARVSYAQLTASGYERLRQAGQTHSDGIRQMFLERFTKDEIDQLASLLSRLATAHPDLS